MQRFPFWIIFVPEAVCLVEWAFALLPLPNDDTLSSEVPGTQGAQRDRRIQPPNGRSVAF